MEPPQRIFINPEQLAILVEMFHREERPLDNSRDKQVLTEAKEKTNLPLQSVKNWISNYKKGPGRGKKKKINAEELTEWTAFLRMSDKDLTGKPFFGFSSEKSKKYRQLKKSKAGRKILSDNLEEQKNIILENLSPQELHSRALAMYDRIEKQIGKLDRIGYKATAMIAQPEGPPTVLGAVAGVAYLRNRQDIVSDYAEHMAGNRTQNDGRGALRSKVQEMFKGLYAKLTGRTIVKYTAILNGTVPIEVVGMPEGVAFDEVKYYSVHEMQEILKAQSNISFQRSEEGDPQRDKHKESRRKEKKTDKKDNSAPEAEKRVGSCSPQKKRKVSKKYSAPQVPRDVLQEKDTNQSVSNRPLEINQLPSSSASESQNSLPTTNDHQLLSDTPFSIDKPTSISALASCTPQSNFTSNEYHRMSNTPVTTSSSASESYPPPPTILSNEYHLMSNSQSTMNQPAQENYLAPPNTSHLMSHVPSNQSAVQSYPAPSTSTEFDYHVMANAPHISQQATEYNPEPATECHLMSNIPPNIDQTAINSPSGSYTAQSTIPSNEYHMMQNSSRGINQPAPSSSYHRWQTPSSSSFHSYQPFSNTSSMMYTSSADNYQQFMSYNQHNHLVSNSSHVSYQSLLDSDFVSPPVTSTAFPVTDQDLSGSSPAAHPLNLSHASGKLLSKSSSHNCQPNNASPKPSSVSDLPNDVPAKSSAVSHLPKNVSVESEQSSVSKKVPKTNRTLKLQDRVKQKFLGDNTWYEGTIVKIRRTVYTIRYDGFKKEETFRIREIDHYTQQGTFQLL